MINTKDILETIGMIREEKLDVRTVTLGISLYDCVSEDAGRFCEKVYEKIVSSAKDLVPVCPNCHTALHSKPGGVYSVEELKAIRKKYSSDAN